MFNHDPDDFEELLFKKPEKVHIMRQHCGNMSPVGVCAEVARFKGAVIITLFINSGNDAIQIFSGTLTEDTEFLFSEVMAVMGDLSSTFQRVIDTLGEEWLALKEDNKNSREDDFDVEDLTNGN